MKADPLVIIQNPGACAGSISGLCPGLEEAPRNAPTRPRNRTHRGRANKDGPRHPDRTIQWQKTRNYLADSGTQRYSFSEEDGGRELPPRGELAWLMKQDPFDGRVVKCVRMAEAGRSDRCPSETLVAQPERRVGGRPLFFIFFRRNPLKSPDSEKEIKGNESNFPFISFLFLSSSSP
jgi:hypothetical protein